MTTYIDLLSEVAPRPIRTKEDAAQVQGRIDTMIDRVSTLTSDELDLLDLLGSLIESWEGERFDPPATTTLGRLRAHLEDNGISQASLVGPVFPTKSIASEVLSGKRPLTYVYVQKLMRHLRLPAAVFFDEGQSHRLTP